MADDPWQLPPHQRREQRQLEAAGISGWQQLAGLSDRQLLRLAAAGSGASEQRLRMLRAQARLVREAGLDPAEAALLLHAGIHTATALAGADPEQLLRQVGRLQRRLLGPAAAAPSLASLRQWIQRARRGPDRDRN